MSHCPTTTARFLALAGLSAAFLMCGSAFTQEETDSGDKIKELKEERLALLVTIQNMTAKGFREGLHFTADQVHQAKLDVFTARLDLAETKEYRIKICEEMVNEDTEWATIVEKHVQAGQLNAVEPVKAQAHVLAARIALEKAKAAK